MPFKRYKKLSVSLEILFVDWQSKYLPTHLFIFELVSNTVKAGFDVQSSSVGTRVKKDEINEKL